MTPSQTMQTTLQRAISISGKGLHNGRLVTLKIHPAPANTGIVFQRIDSLESRPVRALGTEITSTTLSTTIGSSHSAVGTIEHIMAAFSGLGINNAIVKVDSPEIPILDGSAMVFLRKLLDAGLKVLDEPLVYYGVKKTFEVRHGDQFIRVEPYDQLRIRCSIDFANTVIGYQSTDYVASVESFARIARARTFCHMRDVQAMREKGLSLGGSLDNAIVISDDGILNEAGLHSEDEFVEHKLLDLIGDIALLGRPLLGRITAHKPGHTLHAEFTKSLLAMKDEYLEDLTFKRHSRAQQPDFSLFTPVCANLA